MPTATITKFSLTTANGGFLFHDLTDYANHEMSTKVVILPPARAAQLIFIILSEAWPMEIKKVPAYK